MSMFQNRFIQMNRNVISLGFIFLLLILFISNAFSETEYRDWDECSKNEIKGMNDLLKLKKDGYDLRTLLSDNNARKLSIDEEYIIYLLENKEPNKVAYSIIFQCAIKFPDSSPFSKEDLEKLKLEREKAIKKIILQNREKVLQK